jgi:hypothetical protein
MSINFTDKEQLDLQTFFDELKNISFKLVPKKSKTILSKSGVNPGWYLQ